VWSNLKEMDWTECGVQSVFHVSKGVFVRSETDLDNCTTQ